MSSGETLVDLAGRGQLAVLNCTASFANVGLVRDSSGEPTSLWYSTSTAPAGGSAGPSWASVGSYSAPTGWARYVLAGATRLTEIDVYGRWNGTGCTFAVTIRTTTT